MDKAYAPYQRKGRKKVMGGSHYSLQKGGIRKDCAIKDFTQKEATSEEKSLREERKGSCAALQEEPRKAERIFRAPNGGETEGNDPSSGDLIEERESS